MIWYSKPKSDGAKRRHFWVCWVCFLIHKSVPTLLGTGQLNREGMKAA
jgi:hypothetical protein